VSAGFTTWVTSLDVDPVLFAFPLNTAVMSCESTDNAEVCSVACPDPSSDDEPSEWLPSKKSTVPVAAGSLSVTDAVNVTISPNTDGLELECSSVLLTAGVTVCTASPLFARNPLSPR
jgi:hypothetical protein